MRTTFTSEAWIEHTPVQDLRAKDRDAVSRLVTLNLPAAAEGQEIPGLDARGRSDMIMLQRDAVWARVLTAWSYDDLPLPSISEDGASVEGRDSLAELPIDDYDELIDALAPIVAKLLRVPSPKGPPTGTSSSSNGSSRAKAGRSPRG